MKEAKNLKGEESSLQDEPKWFLGIKDSAEDINISILFLHYKHSAITISS